MDRFDALVNLRWASFNDNYIERIEGLENCKRLEELSFENNMLRSLSGIEPLDGLRKLNVNHNEIVYTGDDYYTNTNTNTNTNTATANYDYDSMASMNGNRSPSFNWSVQLPRLTQLSIAHNRLSSLRFIRKLPLLIELYASFNQLRQLRDIFDLKHLYNLAILDLAANPMCAESNYRLFAIYNLKFLKSLDGALVESSELVESKELFGGKLTCDFIAEKLNNTRLSDAKLMDFSHSGIRMVDLGATPALVAATFANLRSLNLENNFLTSFSGIVYLKHLKVLCLDNNKIESIFPKQKGQSQPMLLANDPASSTFAAGGRTFLPSLEVLHLAYNGISDLVVLQVGLLSSLRALFLQGNDIMRIEGIETLVELRELVLDKNKIKYIGEKSFLGQVKHLSELHMEENRLRDLINVECLKSLHKIFASNNRINDFVDIDRLADLNNLTEVSLVNNPVSRVDYLPSFLILQSRIFMRVM